jgi:hypothetical protein
MTSVRENVIHLDLYVQELGTSPLDATTVDRIKTIWDRIRKHSLKRGPEKFLSRASEPKSAVIEEWMPAFFCLPFELLFDLCNERYITPSASLVSIYKSSVVVVPVAEKQVRRIFDLLLSDMMSHGEFDSFKFEFTADDESKSLEVTFSNRVRNPDAHGTGMSQEQVKAITNLPDVDILIEFVPPRRGGQVYKVNMLFRNVMHIQWG